ncbi:hypothetical protein F4825DRAFT_473532 [Nemania diffusa]|nr:hypothetical protein F4825DRAFT_473532 [Nemania diffusa]
MAVPPQYRHTWAFWHQEWDRVSIQIDCINRMIKINYSVFENLGEGGRAFFVRQANQLLNKQTEFFLDNSDRKRVYLASPDDLKILMPSQFKPRLLVNYPGPFPNPYTQQPMATTNYQAPGTGHTTTQSTAAPFGNAYPSPGSNNGSPLVTNKPAINRNWNNPAQNFNLNFVPSRAQNTTTSVGIPPFWNQGLQAPAQPFMLPASGFNIPSNICAPSMSPPDISPPNVSAPDTRAPGLGAPNPRAPNARAPKYPVQTPQVTLPMTVPMDSSGYPAGNKGKLPITSQIETPISNPSTHLSEVQDNGAAEPAPKKARTTKKTKSTAKWPPNPWHIYRQEQHAAVAAQNPSLPNTAIATLVSKQWDALTPEERDRYVERSDNLILEHLRQHPEATYEPEFLGMIEDRRIKREEAKKLHEMTAKAPELPQAPVPQAPAPVPQAPAPVPEEPVPQALVPQAPVAQTPVAQVPVAQATTQGEEVHTDFQDFDFEFINPEFFNYIDFYPPIPPSDA